MGLLHKVRGRALFGADDINVVDTEVSSAELLAINATPKTLVSAPGANKAVCVEKVVALMRGGTPYTANNALEVRYTNGSGALLTGNMPFTNFINANNVNTLYHAVPAGVIPVANAVVVLASAANQATGTGTMKIRTYFRVVELT